MNKSAVRRALTTLKKQGIFFRTDIPSEKTGKIFVVLEVDYDLTQPKKKIYIKKQKAKKIKVNKIEDPLPIGSKGFYDQTN